VLKFTVVITTYNRVSLLKRAVESALSQTIPCEVVIVDDCSTDSTEAYVTSLGDRVIYHRNAANIGHSASINAGVQVAHGNWIKLIDDDDYLDLNCIAEMKRAIAMRPQAVICSCQAIQVDENEVELSRTRQTGPGKFFYVPQEDIHYGMLLEKVPFGTPVQVAFRRDAFLKSGGWDSSLDANCDDIDSWIKIAQFGDAIFINRYLSYRTLWQGAQNRKFSLQERMDTNILMKQKIYSLVSPKHQANVPPLRSIQNYLKLHWGLVALKQKKLLAALKLAMPAVLSPAAWSILARALTARKQPSEAKEVRKLVLTEFESVASSYTTSSSTP
jgi:glycosyltransferase involved in cell wall biosynthesis